MPGHSLAQLLTGITSQFDHHQPVLPGGSDVKKGHQPELIQVHQQGVNARSGGRHYKNRIEAVDQSDSIAPDRGR